MKIPAPAMLTLAALARKCDIAAGKARRLVDEGLLRPDLQAGRVLLFDLRRLPELRAGATASAREIRKASAEIIRAGGLPHRFSPTKQPTNQP